MRTKHLIPGLAVALAFAPAAAVAQKPAKPPKPNQGGAALTLDAKPTTLVFSAPTELSGRLNNATAGTVIRLEQDNTRPYGDVYTATGRTATVTNNGQYTFSVKPARNTQYRTVAQTNPPVISAPKLVLVRTLVGLKLSDSTPNRGSLVRFSGSVFPAKDGRQALIQKRSSTGRFVTIVRTTLRDAGTARSTYSRRIRIRTSGVYRVKVAGDTVNINGFSRERTITVG